MAQQIIDIGTAPGSGNGDPNRTCWVKTNNNFNELYNLYNHTSTQWATTIGQTQIDDGTYLNIFTLLTDADKVAGGTVSRDEYSIVNNGILIPYVGQPYQGLRLHHKIRINFSFVTGGVEIAKLELRRVVDDSVIGNPIIVSRNDTEPTILKNIITYTNNASDPFVTGGFYIAINNQSGKNLSIENGLGVLIQTTYEKPTVFL